MEETASSATVSLLACTNLDWITIFPFVTVGYRSGWCTLGVTIGNAFSSYSESSGKDTMGVSHCGLCLGFGREIWSLKFGTCVTHTLAG